MHYLNHRQSQLGQIEKETVRGHSITSDQSCKILDINYVLEKALYDILQLQKPKMVSEYDQDIPQSQTVDKPVVS